MQEKLNPDFLIELFAGCLKPANKELLQIAVKEISYEYLPDENYKHIFKQICNGYETLKKAPSYGVLSQHFSENLKVLNLLSKLKKVNEVDIQGLLNQLEQFIKEREFLLRFDEFGELWNTGNKEAVYKMLLDTSEKINGFSLRKNSFTRILRDFEERHSTRRTEAFEENMKGKIKKVPFFIDALDDIVKGGMDRGDTYLYIGGSGKFKSTALRYHAYQAANAGYVVVHFQAEDTEKTTTSLYDSALLGESLYTLDELELDSEKVKKLIKNLARPLREGGEVYLKTFEQFNTATLGDCRQYLFDLQREVGEIHLIVWDYLELFDPSDGINYGASDTRAKRESVANKMKNIAMEYNAVGLTATQAMDIPQNLLEDPDFVIRRQHISEFKGLVKPFSGVMTLNQTPDEYEDGIMRIFMDKFRKYKSGQVIKFFQSIGVGRFYNKMKSVRHNLLKQNVD